MAGRFTRFIDDNGVPLVLAGIAFGGSFDHWIHLASDNGQGGILAPSVAICADLVIYMAARERQRDLRTARKRRGIASWPTLVMTGGIILTLAGNVAGAKHTAWGITSALIPCAALLMAISLMERRAAEDGRRHLAAEAERQRQEAEDRQRQAEVAAEAERQERAERQAEDARRRRQERQDELARNRDRIVTLPPGSVTTVSPRLALANGDGAALTAAAADANLTATKVMRAHWDREVAAGRVPSGADLARAAGIDPRTSSLGRQNAGKWREETEEAAG